MKLLLKKIINTDLITKIRNSIGIKKLPINNYLLTKNFSISDAFLWRTDNNFKTVFKYSDLLRLFFNQLNTKIEIHFYDKNHIFIKKIKNNSIKLSNILEIDKDLMEGKEDYGVFYIFHSAEKNLNSSIRNSCYTGFSYNNALPSFVHGNCPTTYQYINNKDETLINKDIVGLSFLQNKKYKIQNFFEGLTKLEIFIQNPTTKTISLRINNNSLKMYQKTSLIYDVTKYNEVEIVSNCLFLRPLIFCYRNNYIDVHHG